MIIIKSGKARLDYYDDNKQYINSTIVKTGDIILLANGGHGFLMLEECEIVEVKQGPYVEDKDKVRFEPVLNENVKIVVYYCGRSDELFQDRPEHEQNKRIK